MAIFEYMIYFLLLFVVAVLVVLDGCMFNKIQFISVFYRFNQFDITWWAFILCDVNFSYNIYIKGHFIIINSTKCRNAIPTNGLYKCLFRSRAICFCFYLKSLLFWSHNQIIYLYICFNRFCALFVHSFFLLLFNSKQ